MDWKQMKPGCYIHESELQALRADYLRAEELALQAIEKRKEAEAEAETLRKNAEGRWDEWLSHALSKWPEAEVALIATRVALGPTTPITQADIDFAKREAL